MKTEQFRNLINLVEGRIPGVDYEQNDTKVVANMTGQDSREYTMLVKNYEELAALEAAIKEAKEQFKLGVKAHVTDAFDAADCVLTRVVKTKSFIIEMSKDPKPTETVQYKKVIDELSNHLTPELKQVTNELMKQFTTVTQKTPTVKITSLKEGLSNLFTRLKNSIFNWAKGYDRKLAQLQSMVQ
jgi:enamine deaminase RidA (YjgF/YER057c/UK114 family)